MAKIGLKRVELTGGEPGILLDSPMMSLMTKTTKKIVMTARMMANQSRYERSKGKHAGFAKPPYVGKVHRGTYTCIGVVQTRTQSGARDNLRSNTLERAIEANSVGVWNGTDVDIARQARYYEQQLNKHLKREDNRIARKADNLHRGGSVAGWEAEANAAYNKYQRAKYAATRKAANAAYKRQKEWLRGEESVYKYQGIKNPYYDTRASLKAIDRHRAKVTGRRRKGDGRRRPR